MTKSKVHKVCKVHKVFKFKIMKKTFLASSLVFLLFVISGCSLTPAANSNQSNKKAPVGDMASSTDKGPQMPKGTKEDLKVGVKVTVMGTAGTDGIVSATRITVGDIGPGNFGQGKFPTSTMASSTKFSKGQRPQRANGQGGGQWAGRGQGGGQSMTRVSGEILKKDDVSLTIKDSAGGSKLVFFSDKTEIFIFQAPTSTSAVKD